MVCTLLMTYLEAHSMWCANDLEVGIQPRPSRIQHGSQWSRSTRLVRQYAIHHHQHYCNSTKGQIYFNRSLYRKSHLAPSLTIQCTIDISRYLSSEEIRKTPHSSPVRARYEVYILSGQFEQIFSCLCLVFCSISCDIRLRFIVRL